MGPRQRPHPGAYWRLTLRRPRQRPDRPLWAANIL